MRPRFDPEVYMQLCAAMYAVHPSVDGWELVEDWDPQEVRAGLWRHTATNTFVVAIRGSHHLWNFVQDALMCVGNLLQPSTVVPPEGGYWSRFKAMSKNAVRLGAATLALVGGGAPVAVGCSVFVTRFLKSVPLPMLGEIAKHIEDWRKRPDVDHIETITGHSLGAYVARLVSAGGSFRVLFNAPFGSVHGDPYIFSLRTLRCLVSLGTLGEGAVKTVGPGGHSCIDLIEALKGKTWELCTAEDQPILTEAQHAAVLEMSKSVIAVMGVDFPSASPSGVMRLITGSVMEVTGQLFKWNPVTRSRGDSIGDPITSDCPHYVASKLAEKLLAMAMETADGKVKPACARLPDPMPAPAG